MISLTTYIYIRESDNKCVHVNAGYGIIGEEYEHDNPDWQPEANWPYKIVDKRTEKVKA